MSAASTALFHRLLPALVLAVIATASNLAAAPVYLGIFDGNDDLTTVKSAIYASTSQNVTLYAYSPALNFGDWSTANILNKNGKQQGLSHLSLWTAPQSSEVPEPSRLALIGGGLTGLAILSKRRKRAA